MKDDRLYVVHVRECIERIERYTAEGRAAFLADTKTQDAVLRNLQTLAESLGNVSDRLKTSYPDVDWRAITAFRNVVVHDYLGVDLEEIWHIVEHDVSDLKSKIETMWRDFR